jgi:hypothetical protein
VELECAAPKIVNALSVVTGMLAVLYRLCEDGLPVPKPLVYVGVISDLLKFAVFRDKVFVL